MKYEETDENPINCSKNNTIELSLEEYGKNLWNNLPMLEKICLKTNKLCEYRIRYDGKRYCDYPRAYGKQ